MKNQEQAAALAKQVNAWRKEVARLQDLIAHATGSNQQPAALDLDSLTRYGFLPGSDEPAGYIVRAELDEALARRSHSGGKADEYGSLACPFCGSHNISTGEVSTTDVAGETVVQSMCMDCGAMGPGAALDNGEVDYGDVKAIAAWNRRAITQPAAAPAPAAAPSSMLINNLRRTLGNIKDATKLADVRSLANLGLGFLDVQAPGALQAAPTDELRACLNALRTAWHISGVVQQREDIAAAITRAESILAAPIASAAPDFWFDPAAVKRTRLTDYADQIEITATSVKFGHATTPLYLAAPATAGMVGQDAKDAARYRYIATLQDWGDIERMCWSTSADGAEEFKRGLDTYIDAKLATLSTDHAECIARIVARQTADAMDLARYRWLCDNNFDKRGVTQVHTWLHTWEPHSQTGEPTEWKCRVRGSALDRAIDAAMAAQQAQAAVGAGGQS